MPGQAAVVNAAPHSPHLHLSPHSPHLHLFFDQETTLAGKMARMETAIAQRKNKERLEPFIRAVAQTAEYMAYQTVRDELRALWTEVCGGYECRLCIPAQQSLKARANVLYAQIPALQQALVKTGCFQDLAQHDALAGLPSPTWVDVQDQAQGTLAALQALGKGWEEDGGW